MFLLFPSVNAFLTAIFITQSIKMGCQHFFQDDSLLSLSTTMQCGAIGLKGYKWLLLLKLICTHLP